MATGPSDHRIDPQDLLIDGPHRQTFPVSGKNRLAERYTLPFTNELEQGSGTGVGTQAPGAVGSTVQLEAPTCTCCGTAHSLTYAHKNPFLAVRAGRPCATVEATTSRCGACLPSSSQVGSGRLNYTATFL